METVNDPIIPHNLQSRSGIPAKQPKSETLKCKYQRQLKPFISLNENLLAYTCIKFAPVDFLSFETE
jgi:hypothetical protein